MTEKPSNGNCNEKGHIRLSEDAHYYSVPCKCIGKKVKLLYTVSEVEVYYWYEKIAEYQRNQSRFRYTTNTDHLASGHRYVTEWSAEKFIAEASSVHPDVGAYSTKVIESKAYPEQGYKSCSGILSFVRRVGASRLINACRWLIVMDYIIIRLLKESWLTGRMNYH